jgi:dihydrofolate reductase
MARLIEYTLVSADGMLTGESFVEFMSFRDDAYLRDGLGVIAASGTMLYGRKTYEGFARLWPGRDHPWAQPLIEIKTYVFTSTLDNAGCENTTLVRGAHRGGAQAH